MKTLATLTSLLEGVSLFCALLMVIHGAIDHATLFVVGALYLHQYTREEPR